MARRNLLRTFLSASLLVGSVAAGVLAAPAPAGAADFVPDHVVYVHETYFESAWGGAPGEPTKVYAHPQETIEFKLVDGVGPHHAVKLDIDCDGRLQGQCERAFDDPNAPTDHPVVFRFFGTGSVPFYDRYAKDEHNFDMGGLFVIQDEPLPAPTTPTTTTTTLGPTTTTTARPGTTTTTRAQTTTTTAPTAIHPQLVSDPPPSTTTTAAPAPAHTNNAPVVPAANKDKDKGKNNDKGKVKAAGTETPTTASLAPVLPTDVVFDAATLTPGPATLSDAPDGGNGDEVAIDAAPVVGLLDHVEKAGDEGDHLLLLALGALTCLLLACGIWGWHNRASRYDPA